MGGTSVKTKSGFSQIDKIGNNGSIGFTAWKKLSDKMFTPSGNRTLASYSLWFQVQHYPFYTKLTFACKTETLGSLYSHVLLILLKSSKSKHQVVHEQTFKDLLSSTCQVSVERIVLDLESQAMRDQGSIPTGGNILSLDFCHIVKSVMPILPLLPILSICEKLDVRTETIY